MRFNGHGGLWVVVGLSNMRGLFLLKQFYDAVHLSCTGHMWTPVVMKREEKIPASQLLEFKKVIYLLCYNSPIAIPSSDFTAAFPR